MIKVSVISPVYKVESFIAKSSKSMMEQTMKDVEFIFVDDCTPDNSVDILKSIIDLYPDRKEQIKIVRHNTNKGLPSARNTGLDLASGEYIFHWDSDDFAAPDMLEKMHSFAKSQDLDIVWCDWFLSFSKNERYMKQPSYYTPAEALSAMLSGKMKYNVWNKLIKKSIYDDFNIRFPDGRGMGEDLTILLTFAHAKKVGYLPKAFYHYVKTNTNSFSLKINPIHFESLKQNVDWIINSLISIKGKELEIEYNLLKLDSKYPLIASNSHQEYYKLWNDWYPESNEYIKYTKSLGHRRYYLQMFARRKVYFLLWAHSKLMNFIYGVIYR